MNTDTESKLEGEMVTWLLPEWAAKVIRQTLEADMQSMAFDVELRKQIREAYMEIEVL